MVVYVVDVVYVVYVSRCTPYQMWSSSSWRLIRQQQWSGRTLRQQQPLMNSCRCGA